MPASPIVYIFVPIFAIIAVLFLGSQLGIARLLSPKNPGAGEKLETYECGELPFDDALVNFNIRYYIFALTFFVFDMEAIYLYPWAVVFQSLGLFALIEMFLFLVILGIGLLYAYKKNVLHWV